MKVKKLKLEIPYDPAFTIKGIFSRELRGITIP